MSYLKLQVDVPVKARIQSYLGKVQGQFGQQNEWQLVVNGEEVLFSCSDFVSEKISQLNNQGMRSIIFNKVKQGMKTFINVAPDQDVPVPAVSEVKKPDWDNIALGKCRTLFLVEAFKSGKTLTLGLINECNRWAQACVDGTVSEDDPAY